MVARGHIDLKSGTGVMSSRSSHVRAKVVALLLSLVALWAFAAVVTLREGLNLIWVDTLDKKLDRPTESLITSLQEERRLSLIYLSGRTPAQRADLDRQRADTDRARATFQRLAGGGDVRTAASAATRHRVSGALNELKGLDAGRGAIDAGIVDRSNAAATFTDFIDAGFRIYGALATMDDRAVAARGRTLVALTRSREMLSEEDALLSGMLAAEKGTSAEYSSFAQFVGAQRFRYTEIEPDLPAAEHSAYQQIFSGVAVSSLRGLEDLVIERNGNGPLPVSAAAWRAAIDPVFSELRDLEHELTTSTVALANQARTGVLTRIGLACGLGLVAVIASIVISITTARSLTRQLERLRAAALDLAGNRLPRVVERIRLGERVDVVAEAPPLAAGTGEIGMVADAFNTVQRTAVEVAVEQAELRRGVRDVFLNLARRTQALVHRQLTVLDGMERRVTDSADLDDLFRVDHLATRMRRNAENLIVLSGALPGRGWRHPVPVVDVIRGATAEVEDYSRVTVLPIGPAALVGRAVGDVIHLLAELIENATSFSPPETVVQVSGQPAKGYAIEVEDRGLGMIDEDLIAANEQLANPPEFNLSSTARLGLYVVGRLASRHGIRVSLRESPYGGTTAIVLIPAHLVVDLPEPDPAALPGSRPAAIGTGAAGADGHDGAARTSTGLLVRRGSRSTDATDFPVVDPVVVDPVVVDPVVVDPVVVDPVVVDPVVVDPVVIEPAANEPVPTAVEPAGIGPMVIGSTVVDSTVVDSTVVESVVVESMIREPVVREPAATGPVTPAPITDYTPQGLPRRVRQANLAESLRTVPAETLEEPAGEPAGGRSPEQLRVMMSSFQRGTRRGRSSATGDGDGTTDPDE
jgi:signal transduction histidine kinase